MSHTTSRRSSAAALGATALLATVLAAPAMASQDPGYDDSGTTSQFPYGLDRDQREGTTDTTAQFPYGLDRSRREGGSTNGIDRNRQLGGFTYSTEVSTLPQQATKPQAGPIVVFRDNDAIEFLQVGAGVLAGLVIAGAGAVIVSRRNHGGLTPDETRTWIGIMQA